MPYPTATRKFLETRALGPGEVRVRIMKGDTLLYSKVGHSHRGNVSVEYMGKRYMATRWDQTWKLDVDQIEETPT